MDSVPSFELGQTSSSSASSKRSLTWLPILASIVPPFLGSITSFRYSPGVFFSFRFRFNFFFNFIFNYSFSLWGSKFVYKSKLEIDKIIHFISTYYSSFHFISTSFSKLLYKFSQIQSLSLGPSVKNYRDTPTIQNAISPLHSIWLTIYPIDHPTLSC